MTNKLKTERLAWMESWCAERNLDTRISNNWDKAAMAWAVKHASL